jgi:hypothetical protein
MPAISRFARWRFSTSLVLLVLFLLFCGLNKMAPSIYQALGNFIDSNKHGSTFDDLAAILEAASCWRGGVDVYTHNACMGGGIYNYAPLLLRAGYLPIGPQNTLAGGLFLTATFILSLALLPAPKSGRECLLRIMAAASPTVFFLLTAANFDIVIFLLTLLGVFLLLAGRIAGYAAFSLAAALKFYPAVLMLLLLKERPARIFAVMALGVVSFAAYMAVFRHGTANALAVLPGALPFDGVFGAKDLPLGLLLLHYLPVLSLTPAYQQYHPALTTHYAVLLVLYFGVRLICLTVLIAGFFAAKSYQISFNQLDDTRKTLCVAAAALMVLCYFFAQNIDYRAVFLLLTLPGLYEMGQAAGHLRLRLTALMIGMVLLLWEIFLRNVSGVIAEAILPQGIAVYPQIAIWLAREILWFWVMVQLAALLICFVKFNTIRLLRTLLNLTQPNEPNTNLVKAQARRLPYA